MVLLPLAVAAAALPSLLAYNLSPSPTFLNQALAFLGWGLFAGALALAPGLRAPTARETLRPAWPALAALALVAAAAAASNLFGSLPASLSLSAIGTLLAAMVLVAAGAAATRGPAATAVFAAFCAAWLFTGLLNVAIGAFQVFAPGWADGEWIARSGMAGRAVGNLRQPNHLSSLLLWAAIGLVGLIELRQLRLRLGAALMAVIVFGVVLTASRTGVVGIGLLAAWALIDRRLARGTRGLLLATPLLYAIGWALMAAWSRVAQATFGGEARLAEADLSASRFGIWADTLSLIRAQPWTGVGFGEFNFAWTLSPMPQRPTAFFDHSHNLPLQLAAELGLPLAALVMGLLLLGLWRGLQRGRRATGEASLTARCAVAMLVLIGLHSLLEYPLWYSYFLLPAAFAFGLALGPGGTAADAEAEGVTDGASSRTPGRTLLATAGLAVALGGVLAAADYARVAAIFSTRDQATPLAQRIERGRASVFFSHHADYAAATVAEHPSQELGAFDQAAHYLLDTRLLLAWARAFAEAGDVERARHLAQRLREFRNPQSAEFLAECERADPGAERPFQCEPAPAGMDWRPFVRR